MTTSGAPVSTTAPLLTATCATAPNHETSVDGTHPSDYGYTLWAESIRKPIVKILRKYGIR